LRRGGKELARRNRVDEIVVVYLHWG
jgi:poly-gamma-glutamate capsule biosynthesis protein CapA/YwtB (metallophosphatase superfamily)